MDNSVAKKMSIRDTYTQEVPQKGITTKAEEYRIVVSAGTSLTYIYDRTTSVHTYGEEDIDHTTFVFIVEQDALLELYWYALGILQFTSIIRIELVGERAQAVVKGAYLLAGDTQGTLTLTQYHAAPHTKSSVQLRGVLKESARMQMTGMIHVTLNAPHTQASLENKNMLRSTSARVISQPQLEVLTDEVHCSHGSAVGFLDEHELFFMHARGIAPEQARLVMLEGFLASVLEDNKDNTSINTLLRAYLKTIIQ